MKISRKHEAVFCWYWNTNRLQKREFPIFPYSQLECSRFEQKYFERLTTTKYWWCSRPASPKPASQMRKEGQEIPKSEVVLSLLWDASLYSLCAEVNDGFSVALGHHGVVHFQQGLWELNPWWRRQGCLRKTNDFSLNQILWRWLNLFMKLGNVLPTDTVMATFCLLDTS